MLQEICLEGSWHFLVSLRISGDTLDRARIALGQLDSQELVKDHVLTLSKILLSRNKLELLREELTTWLREPHEFTLALGDESQALVVSIGIRDDVICSIEKAACTIRYGTSRLAIESWFVVDQSCIRILRDGVQEWLVRKPGSLPPVSS